MKKLLGAGVFLILQCALWSCTVAGSTPIFSETKSDGTRENAQVICMNAITEGGLVYNEDNDGYDVDKYRLLIPETGEINVHFRHN